MLRNLVRKIKIAKILSESIFIKILDEFFVIVVVVVLTLFKSLTHIIKYSILSEKRRESFQLFEYIYMCISFGEI